jgi:hypothetical protein
LRKRPTQTFRSRYDSAVRAAFSRFRRRIAVLTIGLAGAVVLASSCSLDAALRTDRDGRVRSVNAVRVQSTLRDFGLAMLVRGREFVLELTWRRGFARAPFT